jgi:hypothetical protein
VLSLESETLTAFKSKTGAKMTAQIAETMIYKGEELSLCDEPLHYYLQTIAGGAMSALGRLKMIVCIS